MNYGEYVEGILKEILSELSDLNMRISDLEVDDDFGRQFNNCEKHLSKIMEMIENGH